MEKKRNNWFSFTIFKESFKSNFISLFIVGIGNALIALVVILILSTLSLNTTKQSMLNMFNTANMEHTLKQSSAGAYIAFNGIIEAHENVMPQAENYLFTAYEGTSSAVDLLNGEYDDANCYLEIHPGAGGTESCDWASMLLRMYQRFLEKNHFQVKIIDYQDGDEAGIKSVTLLISGAYAYGYLKVETGVHRLVRISPFDSNRRRHTSFASVTVTPVFDTNINIEIKDEDLKIDVYHSSGAGGQSVNTSNSAVRITHLPTKTVVTCQTERSQLRNKEIAMELLKSKLYQKELAEQEKKKKEINGDVSSIDFGSQIRSYILEPYKLVKDHRSKYESTDPIKVLDGDIMPLIKSVLKLKP